MDVLARRMGRAKELRAACDFRINFEGPLSALASQRDVDPTRFCFIPRSQSNFRQPLNGALDGCPLISKTNKYFVYLVFVLNFLIKSVSYAV